MTADSDNMAMKKRMLAGIRSELFDIAINAVVLLEAT